MSVSTRRLEELVDGALTVRLATISKRGTPLLTPLWFARDGDVIYVGTRRGSPHVRHMSDNPRVVMLFEIPGGESWLEVVGIASVHDYESMSLARKARMAWRYFLRPAALTHWARHWRKLSMRKRYYAERTDSAMVEIALLEAELVTV